MGVADECNERSLNIKKKSIRKTVIYFNIIAVELFSICLTKIKLYPLKYFEKLSRALTYLCIHDKNVQFNMFPLSGHCKSSTGKIHRNYIEAIWPQFIEFSTFSKFFIICFLMEWSQKLVRQNLSVIFNRIKYLYFF